MARRRRRKKKRRVLPIFASDQRYACRDCPARCCRLPGRVRLIADDAERLAADAWAIERMGEGGRRIVERGWLPVREEAGHTQCVFLDDDDLCGLHKEHGHAFLPRACRAFPFGFVRDEEDVLRASASRLCPSIRDSYGEPAARQVDAKLEQLGVADRVSDGISSGQVLTRAQAVEEVEAWREQLASSSEPLANLAKIHDGLVTGGESTPLSHTRRAGYFGGMLLAHLLSHICYPARVVSRDRVDAAPWYRFISLRSFFTRLSCWLGWGSVDMLFVEERVPMGRALGIAPPTRGELGAELARYLCLAIDRRRILAQPRALATVFLDLVLAAVIASRFARCRAAAARRATVELSDVREGIAVAELLVLSHATPGAESDIVRRLRAILLARPDRLRRLLSTEA